MKNPFILAQFDRILKHIESNWALWNQEWLVKYLNELSGHEPLSHKQITHLPCNRLNCGVCELPDEHILFMKGICQDYIESVYDVLYHVSGVKHSQPYFK